MAEDPLLEEPVDPAGVPIHETVGIFPDRASLQGAIDDLHLAGFDRWEISLLDRDAKDDNADPHELARDPATPRRSYVAPESVGDAQGGLIAGFALLPAMGAAAITAGTGALVVATAATGGAGLLVGGGLAYALMHRRQQQQRDQTDEGELMLWVRTKSDRHRRKAEEVFSRHGAHLIESHE